jgi:hypothetical protein
MPPSLSAGSEDQNQENMSKKINIIAEAQRSFQSQKQPRFWD